MLTQQTLRLACQVNDASLTSWYILVMQGDNDAKLLIKEGFFFFDMLTLQKTYTDNIRKCILINCNYQLGLNFNLITLITMP